MEEALGVTPSKRFLSEEVSNKMIKNIRIELFDNNIYLNLIKGTIPYARSTSKRSHQSYE